MINSLLTTHSIQWGTQNKRHDSEQKSANALIVKSMGMHS
jgi:hypothetical protein